MENAQLIGLSRQVALRRELDVVANNVANINTAGFKRHTVMFEDFLMPVAEYNTKRRGDRVLHYVSDRATYRDFTAGDYQNTENPFDIALRGDGWLAIQTPNGERYTRDGAMTVDTQGQLVTHAGNPVVGDDGPIIVPLEATSFTIGRDGTVSAGGEQLGKLRIVQFENKGELIAEGSNLFRSEGVPQPAPLTTVLQGTIERSNIDGVLEISRLIEINRMYTSLSNALERTERLRRTAIDKLGSADA